MKTIKPGRIDDDDIIEQDSVDDSEQVLTPSRVLESEVIDEIVEEEEKRLTSLRGIGAFAKKSMIVLGLLFGVIITGTLYDAATSASSMLHNAPIVGVMYLVMLFSLIGILGFGIFKEMLGYLKIKKIDTIQEEATALTTKSSKKVRAFAKKVIALYSDHEDEQIRDAVKAFSYELPSMLDDEIMQRLNDIILTKMDEKAKKIITKYANQTALSTAISPVAMIDAILILSRSHVMVKEIATVYGLRPNLFAELALIKKVFVTMAFAGITDIMLHHSHDILGASVLSKISSHGAQGVANGILTARIGLSTIKACRPVALNQKQDGFFKNILKMITKSLFSSKP